MCELLCLIILLLISTSWWTLCQGCATRWYPLIIESWFTFVPIEVWYSAGHVLFLVQSWGGSWWLIVHRWVWFDPSRELLPSLLKVGLILRIRWLSIDRVGLLSRVKHTSLVLYFYMNRIVRGSFDSANRSRWILTIRLSALIKLISLHIDAGRRPIHGIVHHTRLVHILLSIYIERVLSRLLLGHVTLTGGICLNSTIIWHDWAPNYSKSRRVFGLSRGLLLRSSWIVGFQGRHWNGLLEALRHSRGTLRSHILLRTITAGWLLSGARYVSIMTHSWPKLTLVSTIIIVRKSCSLSLSLFREALVLRLILILRINQLDAFIIIIILPLFSTSLELHRVLLSTLDLSTSGRKSWWLMHDTHLSL